jgi:DNA-binding MarR family transcriptional regulator
MAEPTTGEMIEQALAHLARWVSRPENRRDLLGPAAGDLSPTDVWLLRAIAEQEPVRVSSLAAWQGVDKSTVTPQVRRLEQQGLVSRRGDPSDRRAVLLNITAAGHQLDQQLTVWGAAVFDRLLENWPEDDRQSLGRLMTRLTREMMGRTPVERVPAEPSSVEV